MAHRTLSNSTTPKDECTARSNNTKLSIAWHFTLITTTFLTLGHGTFAVIILIDTVTSPYFAEWGVLGIMFMMPFAFFSLVGLVVTKVLRLHKSWFRQTRRINAWLNGIVLLALQSPLVAIILIVYLND